MATNTKKQIIPEGIEYFPDCAQCSKLCTNAMSVCMEGEGPDNADFMIIGDVPTESDDEFNRPFYSSIGDLLRDDLLVNAGIPESKVRFTHAVRCHKGTTPTVLEIKKCRRYLEAEIRRVKPKVIVGMGNAALATMLQFIWKGGNEEGTSKSKDAKVSGIIRWQGRMVWLNEFNCWFMPTYSPLYCVMRQNKRSYYTTDLVVRDLARAWRAIDKSPPLHTPRSVYLNSPVKVHAMLNKMIVSDAFAYDIETGGTGRSIDKWIIGASFSCSEKVGYYVPWRVFKDDSTLMSKLDKLLNNKKHLKIMHNGAYETRIHEAVGMPISGTYFDTMLAAHLIDENFSKRLKDLAWIYSSIGGYDIELEKYKAAHKIKEDYSQIPEEMLAPYGGYDAVVTFGMYKQFLVLLKKEQVEDVFHKIVMPVRKVMSDAEISGFYVDFDRAIDLAVVCEQAIGRLENSVYEAAGKEFNINSPIQLQNVLFKDLGLKWLKKTKTGYSTDKDSLNFLSKQDHPIVSPLLQRAYVSTMLGTHISQAIEFTWPDHRIHTNYNLAGAVTGRTSASNPSLQNVPSDRLVRSLYRATPGNFLLEADLKSAELAAIAAVSGEEVFIKAFAEGLDPHSATYRQLYGLPDTYICDEIERRKAKTVNFGLVFGLTPMGLAVRLDISEEEAQEFMDLYFRRMPCVAKWMAEQRRLVVKNGYVVSVFGRKRRLPYAQSDSKGEVSRAERQAMNSPIQSVAADYTYIGLNRFSRALTREEMEAMIVHTVHDCVVADVPPFELGRAITLVHESFEKRIKALDIQMRVDVKVSELWGEHNKSRLAEIIESVGLKAA